MGLGRWYRLLPVPETASAATDLDLISYLQAIPVARMRRGVRIPAWYLMLVAVLGILSRSQSLRDLERFARRHHAPHPRRGKCFRGGSWSCHHLERHQLDRVGDRDRPRRR